MRFNDPRNIYLITKHRRIRKCRNSRLVTLIFILRAYIYEYIYGEQTVDSTEIVESEIGELPIRESVHSRSSLLEQSVYLNENHPDAFDVIVYKQMSRDSINMCFRQRWNMVED